MVTFRNLTPQQERVFEQVAAGNDIGHPTRTLYSLYMQDLIERYTERVNEHYTQIRYRVGDAVHREWATWCAEREELSHD